ncbi:MAG: P1 family peptidase [Bryobacterales bacterium]|nr:P1 family peptidase [Bryobacterales bacterium]
MKGLTDIDGILVGHATDLQGVTGCTAILCPNGAVGGIDIRGSATGSTEWDLLTPGHVTERIHAIVLTGGSAYGLESASGVRRVLEARGIGYKMPSAVVPLVAGAVIYDLGIGKPNARPTREMGEAAAAAASADAGKAGEEAVKEGAVGAGTGATVGKVMGMSHAMKSGLGTATVALEGSYAGVLVSALAVVNALGDVREPATGKILAGTRVSAASQEFADSAAVLKRGTRARSRTGGNTTLVVVATNARLNKVAASKLAALGSIGMARSISPVWTTADGDVVFALSAGTKQADLMALGVAAAEAVEQAIVRAVKLAPTVGGVPGLAG